MSWMRALYDTYDNHKMFELDATSDYPLCPISHMESSAQIEIALDLEGNFQQANSIADKKKGEFFIPVSEDSAGRSSGIAPHALYDNLTYVAGDFGKFCSTQKETDSSEKRFEKYKEELEKWDSSEFSTPRLHAIYKYISKECMAQDLIKAGVLVLDDKNHFKKDTIAGNPYDKCIVRFRVFDDGVSSECWNDLNLITAYQKYYMNKKSESEQMDVCYFSGEKEIVTYMHPKGVIKTSNNAKLISTNDMTDFTFRGRFAKGEEALAVGYEASQKIHNALRWLVKVQGYGIGGSERRTYLCWNPKGKKVPKADGLILYDYDDEADEEDFDEKSNRIHDLQEYRIKIKRTVNGYREKFDLNDTVTIMAMQAATTGRLSIVYYNELNAHDYLNRIEQWYETCCWEWTSFDKDKKPKLGVRSPSINEIVSYSFGNQQGNEVKVDDKLKIMQYQRVYHCVIENQNIPIDFVQAAFQRACRPLSFSNEPGNRQRERQLFVTCALISKYKGGSVKMSLDRNNTNRSYLYGRLLAVYERIEWRTYTPEQNRETNAIRYQNAYSQRPAAIRKVIEEVLDSYYAKLPYKEALHYKKEIEEISNHIEIDKYINAPLGYEYLIGYWAERAELRKPYVKKENDSTENA